MPNQPRTPVRGFRLSDEVYLPALAKSRARGESLSAAVRGFLKRYAALPDKPSEEKK